MAKVTAAWGIDIGQCALKALRCRPDPEHPGRVIAEAFDYIEYPKLLSQPEADAPALVREALGIFLSRNSVRGDKVAISVSGSSGLARFIKLPPVETKKIPDIVRYEANQQIPFDLKDVIWDYQRMYGGSEEEGFALETEIGLFAMKRDQVYQALEPYRTAGIEVDVVQLTPLALYNFLVVDRLGELTPEDQFDPENPPESIMALSLGTETTDLVITNGFRVWQRNIPVGGSHFTKALTKELKLTYAKAEHLKRNAAAAEDPKAVYQAMRPVFKDLLTEVQRSVGFFNSLDKTAKIGKVVTLGNSMKLPGLKRYLSQNLGFEVAAVDAFTSLGGPAVTGAPAFRNNLLCFGVAYGLALQGLRVARLGTNLVPVEMVRDRIIREKKPWALAASLLVAVGAVASFLLLWWPWSQIRIDVNQNWKDAVSEVKNVDRDTMRNNNDFNSARNGWQALKLHGDALEKQLDRRLWWPEMLLAVNQCLPQDPPGKEPVDLAEREQLHIVDLRAQKYDELSTWLTPQVRSMYAQNSAFAINPPVGPAPAAPQSDPMGGGHPRTALPPRPRRAPSMPPSGPGYVVQIRGYHLHNSPTDFGADFLRRTLIDNLDGMPVHVPSSDGTMVEVSTHDLGISYPIIFWDNPQTPVEVTNPRSLFDPLHPERVPDPTAPKNVTLYKYDFIVQFAWVPRIPGPKPSGGVIAHPVVAPAPAGARK